MAQPQTFFSQPQPSLQVAMDDVQFVLEDPSPQNSGHKRRKRRLRLVTSCDAWYELVFFTTFVMDADNNTVA